MPESRPLSSLRASYFDIPPATSDTSSSYPDRHTSLRRALRNTTDLARDAAQGGNSAFGPAIDSPRSASMSFLRRARRRIRESTRTGQQTEDDNADDAPEIRSSKRRRLNTDTPRPAKGPIKYGRYGQVETGRLRMEIVSNDGGEHKDPRHPGIFLGASNILKMDKSVFCSERTSAGIMLKHADNTPFCLEKLHIVGPEHGFTAPVREGIVYVAMDMEDLRLYQDPPFHARRSGIHEPPYIHSRYRNIRASPERLTLSDALRDPEIANGRFSPIPREPEDPPDEESYYDADYLRQAEPEFHCDIPSPPADSLQTSFSESSVPFTVLSDEEPEVEDVSPQEVLDYRLQRMRRMPRRHDPDSLDREEGWSNADPMGAIGNAWSQATGRLETLMARARPYHSPSPDETPTDNRHGPAERSKVPPPGFDDPSVTTARFYIKRGKSRIAIKFDPPVSGRYILLKLWANRSNVDVQSVIAKGYAGPRFFPAMELV